MLETLLVAALVAASTAPTAATVPSAPLAPTAAQTAAQTNQPFVVQGLAANEIHLSDGTLVYRTPLSIVAVERIAVPNSEALVVKWRETDGAQETERYRIRLTPNQPFGRARDMAPTIHLQRGTFDPLRESAPAPAKGLTESGRLYIVQFETQSIEAYRDALRAQGAVVRHYLPESANLVEMDAATAAEVGTLPFVRWVGPYHAAYRLEQELLDGLEQDTLPAKQRLHIQVLERGPEMKGRVAARVKALGAEVVWSIEEGFRFDALLSPEQMQLVASWDEVLWIDRWTAPEVDMDKVRVDGGANQVELVAGFNGTGVRAECMDGNVLATHPDLISRTMIFHGPNSGDASHGTPVTGIVFGDGAGLAARRGMLPQGQPIFADYGNLNNRYAHTAELLQSPYFACFQTNSWGSGLTSSYTSTSMEMDDILFLNDIVITQSQSNAGSTSSRPQAWAKNIVSVGGIRHQNTQNLGDDAWGGAGSIGPAQDGRLKPDLSYWYDSITSPSSSGGSTEFGGTSAATPMTAGHFGLFYEMWHAGIFGNAPGATVFDSRPKATLSRAFMINTASRYAFNGSGADLTRVHQGWGRANVQTLYENRDKFFWVNETDVLAETESVAYPMTVDANTPELVVTLVYLEPTGTTSASLHRINDLSLKVTEPGGQVFYWGNNGLTVGNASTAGGVSNTKDPVEMVIIPNPAAGVWTVEVFADDINVDSHVETPALDADFALVVRGTTGLGGTPCLAPTVFCTGAPNSWSPLGARLVPVGSTSVSANNMQFQIQSMSQNTFGVVFQGDLAVATPSGFGTLCVAGQNARLGIIQSDFFGLAYYTLDLTAPPTPASAIVSGSTWNFQCWYRDNQSGTAGFNFSDAVSITWCD
ncbi:MAG: S8 family serine peptidase [Planctomycetota bacterium]